ncbi:uncharacterized protein BDZ99DRAFT_36873 [Mytilinidion resinicola]|uniref:2EXR domain-containing protein n=1 Tax=Mytilinidion resinicola TaxID=574789 RepID=A0A6A6YM03_9PEZI|nr:uncharacterized protein BDZ99DRAFT_36873 [Mytilinidion resinicola]KAF2809811.1 hypothetical protein BDZ99DRAFT_36873 [Mytilinidion resinicola]
MATFHPFPRLPVELRARIWEMTVEPRTVEIRLAHAAQPSICHLFSSTPVPATLQACHEARTHGLYQQAFSEIYYQVPSDGAEWRYVWLNLDIDMISIGQTSFFVFKSVAPTIKRLKFERENSDEGFYHWESSEIRDFVNVKEIHVVCADGMGAWHKATYEHYFPCGPENVFYIDPGGQMMRSIELDDMCDRELEESYRQDGYDYHSGLPLDDGDTAL